jgi:hypothetical protein
MLSAPPVDGVPFFELTALARFAGEKRTDRCCLVSMETPELEGLHPNTSNSLLDAQKWPRGQRGCYISE